MILRDAFALCVAPLLVAALASAQAPPRGELLDLAAGHVALADESSSSAMLWGRLGGSEAERKSAELLKQQIAPFLSDLRLEAFEFDAYRPVTWEMVFSDGAVLSSAMPAPFDAWFPDVVEHWPVVAIGAAEDWARVRGAWAFVEATTRGSAASTSVRDENLYQRAVDEGAVGLIFSIPTPPGDWRAVAPVDKFFTERDTRYPDHRRPIPSFCLSSDDGARVRTAVADGLQLKFRVEYAPETRQHGLNTVGTLASDSARTVLIMCHLDSFFSGANDDASGIAVMVGLAEALHAMDPAERNVTFLFAGISAHHDEGAGMRAFIDSDAARADAIESVILLEHLDAHPGALGDVPGWPARLNDFRAAYLGPNGWDGLETRITPMLRDSGLMTTAPRMVPDCIADLFVVCGEKKTFCLMQAPPFYHTNHDTMDKLTEAGLQNAVDFHLRFLAEVGCIADAP